MFIELNRICNVRNNNTKLVIVNVNNIVSFESDSDDDVNVYLLNNNTITVSESIEEIIYLIKKAKND